MSIEKFLQLSNKISGQDFAAEKIYEMYYTFSLLLSQIIVKRYKSAIIIENSHFLSIQFNMDWYIYWEVKNFDWRKIKSKYCN